jgi:hypothetical protein
MKAEERAERAEAKVKELEADRERLHENYVEATDELHSTSVRVKELEGEREALTALLEDRETRVKELEGAIDIERLEWLADLDDSGLTQEEVETIATEILDKARAALTAARSEGER